MENLWPSRVSHKTIRLLNRWVERHCTQGLRSTYRIHDEERHVVEKFRDQFGYEKLQTYILRGFVGIDKGKGYTERPWTDLDEFGAVFNAELPEVDRMVILAAEDPCGELEDARSWKQFLRISGIKKRKTFEEMLTRAMALLQQILERRGIVPTISDEVELHGWKAIGDELGVTEQTVAQWARDPDMRLPISVLGKRPYTTKRRIDEWKRNRLEEMQIWKGGLDVEEPAG